MQDMTIPTCPFTVTDWNAEAATTHAGDSGHAQARQLAVGDISMRTVEYSAHYTADHWCDRGHIAVVLEGEMQITLQDGQTFTLTAGMSFHASDDTHNAHRASTLTGAKLFIVD